MATARKAPAKKPAAKKPTRTTPIARTAAPAAAKLVPVKVLTPVKPAAPAKAPAAPKAGKADKPRKPKLVRDSFTIPKNEYGVIEALKQRAARLGRAAKKSEVLRAGVKALEAMNDAAFLACVSSVPAVKTGRPAKG